MISAICIDFVAASNPTLQIEHGDIAVASLAYFDKIEENPLSGLFKITAILFSSPILPLHVDPVARQVTAQPRVVA